MTADDAKKEVASGDASGDAGTGADGSAGAGSGDAGASGNPPAISPEEAAKDPKAAVGNLA